MSERDATRLTRACARPPEVRVQDQEEAHHSQHESCEEQRDCDLPEETRDMHECTAAEVSPGSRPSHDGIAREDSAEFAG